jgi:hypothetical protein
MWSNGGITVTMGRLQYYKENMLDFYFVHYKSQTSKTDSALIVG